MEYMEYVAIVVILALLQYQYFAWLVGKARMKYGVSAPAVTGDPAFERHYRVHQNTMEQLATFIPAVLVCGYYADARLAAALGLLFLGGRMVYQLAYLKDPSKRHLGFVLGWIAYIALMVAALFSIIARLFF